MVVLDVTKPVGMGTDDWHSDSSGKPEPAMGAVLRAVKLPPAGGDTCWASMFAAYDGLSAPMQDMLTGLTALHDFARPLETAIAAGYDSPVSLADIRRQYPPMEHPLVRTHPVTKRRGLFVNHNYTTRICQLTAEESRQLLPFLVEPRRPARLPGALPLGAQLGGAVGQPLHPALRPGRLLGPSPGHAPGQHRRRSPVLRSAGGVSLRAAAFRKALDATHHPAHSRPRRRVLLERGARRASS